MNSNLPDRTEKRNINIYNFLTILLVAAAAAGLLLLAAITFSNEDGTSKKVLISGMCFLISSMLYWLRYRFR